MTLPKAKHDFAEGKVMSLFTLSAAHAAETTLSDCAAGGAGDHSFL